MKKTKEGRFEKYFMSTWSADNEKEIMLALIAIMSNKDFKASNIEVVPPHDVDAFECKRYANNAEFLDDIENVNAIELDKITFNANYHGETADITASFSGKRSCFVIGATGEAVSKLFETI